MLIRGISKMNQWVNVLADNLSFTFKIHMVKEKTDSGSFPFTFTLIEWQEYHPIPHHQIQK